MTDKEILQKAITKAIKNGFKIDAPAYDYMPESYFEHLSQPHNSWCVLFDHNFAKAFWGESKVNINKDKRFLSSGTMTYGWRWHLQEMVLEENPIQYLEKYL